MPPAERDQRDVAFFQSRIDELMPNVLVQDAENKIVGFAAWDGAVLGQIFVDAAYRGSGLAKPLLAAAERRMAEQGVAEAELHCLHGNDRARRFYERNGWTVQRVFAYPVKGEAGDDLRDFWAMTKDLPDHQR